MFPSIPIIIMSTSNLFIPHFQSNEVDNENRKQPRQIMRIQKTDAGNGLVKVELRYVSYQSEETLQKQTGQEEVTSNILGHLLARYNDLQSKQKAVYLDEQHQTIKNLILKMEQAEREE